MADMKKLAEARDTLAIALDKAFRGGVFGIEDAGPVTSAARLVFAHVGEILASGSAKSAPQLEAVPLVEEAAPEGAPEGGSDDSAE